MTEIITPPKLVKSQKGWYVYYSIYENGKRKKCTYTDNMNREKNLKERQKIANRLLRDIVKVHEEKKSDVPKSLKPLFVYINEMVELKKMLRMRSHRAYNYASNTLKKFIGTSMLPEQFTNTMAMQFGDWLVSEGYKGRTFNNMVAMNRVILNMLVDRDILPSNPLKKVKRTPVGDGRNTAFNPKQKKELKEYFATHDPIMWDFIKFIYHLWIRPSELLQMKISDIHLERKVVMIWGGVGKNRRQMPVDIPDSFIEEMKAIGLSKLNQDYYLFGSRFKPSPNAITSTNSSKRHSKALEALKYNGYTLYSWKATGMCDAYDAGVDIYAIMRQARHHSLDQTITYLKSMGRIPNVSFKSKAPSL